MNTPVSYLISLNIILNSVFDFNDFEIQLNLVIQSELYNDNAKLFSKLIYIFKIKSLFKYLMVMANDQQISIYDMSHKGLCGNVLIKLSFIH